MTSLTSEQIRSGAAALGEWFHNIDLKGIPSAPHHFLFDYPNVKWQRFQNSIPQDLSGCTVLDIGCNAGFYALEMKRRGADRVVAIDSDERYLAQARFAADVLGQSIDFRNLSVYHVAELHERFDIVLFLGVLYHLRHPLLALDLIHEHVTCDLLVFQSMQRGSNDSCEVQEDHPFAATAHFDDNSYPKMHFIEHRYAGDPTNWWVPNAACSEAMLRSAGFEILERPEDEVFVCRHQDRPAD